MAGGNADETDGWQPQAAPPEGREKAVWWGHSGGRHAVVGATIEALKSLEHQTVSGLLRDGFARKSCSGLGV